MFRPPGRSWLRPASLPALIFEDLGHEVVAVVRRRRDRLVVFAPIWLGHGVIAQAQGNMILVGLDRLIQWFDGAGVDRLHLLDQGKYAVQLLQRLGSLQAGELDLGQFDQFVDVFESKGHDMGRGGRAG